MGLVGGTRKLLRRGGTGVNMTNDVGNLVISADGEVTMSPRIDSH